MPLHAATTLRGALYTLGRDDETWLRTVDALLGQVLSGTSIQQSMHGLYGWIEGGELSELLREAMARTTQQLPSLRGLVRLETVSAVHTVLVARAFFESIRKTLADVDDLCAPDGEVWHQEDHSFVSHLYSDDVPAPSARDFADSLQNIVRWAADRAERVHRALNRSNPVNTSKALLEVRFPWTVATRYEADYRSCATRIPEFAVWADPSQESLDQLESTFGHDAQADFHRDARTTLTRLNNALLEEHLLGDADLPTFEDVYVQLCYRMITAGPLALLASDSWWSSEVPRQSGLHTLLTRHFTSSESSRAPLLMIGGPGSGKSMLTKVVAARIPDSGFTVVTVPLRSTAIGLSVVEQVELALQDHTEGRVGWSDLGEDRIRVVVLDGLDEMPTTSGRPSTYLDEVVRFQQAELQRGRPVAVVVSCRTSFVDQVLIPDGTPVVQLAELDDTQIAQWVERWNRADSDTRRRPLRLDDVLARVELSRSPLSLAMLAVLLTNPAVPLQTKALTVADLYLGISAQSADKASHLAIAALGKLNRGWRPMSEADLRADLDALGHRASGPPADVLRDLETGPATFAEYRIAAFVVEKLDVTAASARRTSPPEDDLLFALLSHHPLALRPSTLTFVSQLTERMPAGKRDELTQVLHELLREYRTRQSTYLYSDYQPTAPDHIRSLAAYSANLVLLRLFIQPADEVMRVSPAVSKSLTDLWSVGLDDTGLRSMRSSVLIEGEVMSRRAHRASAGREVLLDPDMEPMGVEVVHRALVSGEKAIGQVTWSSDGGLLTANSGGVLACWQLAAESPAKHVLDFPRASDVAWHPTRPIAAIVQRKKLLDAKKNSPVHHVLLASFGSGYTTRVLCRVESGTRICWSPDGATLALLDDGALWTIDVATGHQREVFLFSAQRPGRTPYQLKPRWSKDGEHIWTGDARGVHRFAVTTPQRETHHFGTDTLDFHLPDGLAAVASRDGTDVEIHVLGADKASAVLEGHTKRVVCARFSPDGRYLASMSTDNTVRIWRSRDWQCVAVLPREDISRRGGLAFHPAEPLLAVKNGNGVDIVRLDHRVLGTIGAAANARRYSNAKIVLVGDTGVGKSGLGLVLSGQPFEPTESTHGRNVWTFDKSYATTLSGETETRESLIWDLAGQPGYRMVHQLHLNEVAVALVVFDARSETDPFAGVRYWSRALAQARKLDGAAAVRLRTYLVAARADRGTPGVNKTRIEQTVQELGFDGYLETSAKEGWGVGDLITTVRNAIDWDAVPAISSTALFQEIKDFLLEEKKQGRILTTVDDLLHTFRRVRQDETRPEDLADGFSACLGRLESVGVVRRMAFGDYVLLRPELLDAYASSLVQAAKDEPDGLGFVSESNVLEGRFRMPESDRLTNKQQERILLITVVEELLRREIALKEVTDKEVDLIFPSQFTRERPDVPLTLGLDVVFTFDGDLSSIYATLAVRLSHSRLFQRGPMYRNSASYRASAGGMCGMAIHEIAEGRAELALFYEDAQPIVRRQFEAYVVEHLDQRAAADTVFMRRVRRCEPCNYAIDDEVVQRRLGRGMTTVTCQICDAVIPILDEEQPDVRPAVAEMNSNANAQRDQDVAATTLKGKREAEDYDVFLCHNTKDKPLVLEIARRLEARGILPWLDVRAIQPGSRWQQEMANGIAKSRSAAVLIGPSGPGPWHEAEMELINDWSARNRNRRVIPVILDGIDGDPELPGFLRVWSTIDMRMADPDPLEQLIWGITGEQPRWA